MGPHCVASVHRLYLSVTCKHAPSPHTHTQFYIEFSRSMVGHETNLCCDGWDEQCSHSDEKKLIVVDHFAIHNYKVCLLHVSFQIGSIWCHEPKDPNLNYV